MVTVGNTVHSLTITERSSNSPAVQDRQGRRGGARVLIGVGMYICNLISKETSRAEPEYVNRIYTPPPHLKLQCRP